MLALSTKESSWNKRLKLQIYEKKIRYGIVLKDLRRVPDKPIKEGLIYIIIAT